MSLLPGSVRKQAEDLLKDIQEPVRLVYFTMSVNCPTCAQVEQLYREVSELSDKLTLEVHNLALEKELAAQYRISRVPGLAIVGKEDYGVRYLGMPSGYEFGALLEDIVDVSRGSTDLPEALRERLRQLPGEVHLMVFVTPTCPYCPGMVRLTHKAAIEAPQVFAEMVEAQEFMDLAQRFQVMGVPMTVLNEKAILEGLVPEEMFVQWLEEQLKNGNQQSFR